MVHIHNSLTGRKQPLQPLEPGHVRIYVCGITVYDYCHVGHARMLVVFDMVVRYLRWRGYRVTYVRNITDIDDKIIQRARERDESIDALTERFIAAMHEDADALGVLRPDVEPRATGSIDAIVAMIQVLLDKSYAYRAETGDIYYEVSRFAPYGQLSNKRIEDLRAGARVEVDAAKHDPLDFVLWKAAKPGEPSWPAPWGDGRPGWHIECSAMSTLHLGNHFDIHGGGMDLKFPHHENEIAQSEAVTGCHFVDCWMHNGFVQIDDEKMSKSLGNFFTVREVLQHYPPEVLRYFILASHYRRPLNYSDRSLNAARSALIRLYTALRGCEAAMAEPPHPYADRFRVVMDDDFNTPEALAVLHDLASELNRRRQTGEPVAELAAGLRHLGGVLGLLQDDPERFLRGTAHSDALADEDIEGLLAQRAAARRERDWSTADRIRDQLAEQGVVIEDGARGTTWRRA